ncbi:XisI protein [Nostoc sp. XA010]|uniref:element excision factor XisI family protein n=1 Tax=Nostoc sp. XA010 TaxID=2780407 RepID=UPI001E34CB43|nr:element excision factor XisI family protein [Nostoc sp. XA010]MCC5657913.1 XisI protein [Nostoc sp. XA010]
MLFQQKEQWVITDDPLKFKFGNVIQVDLGAERLVAAERAGDCAMDKITKYREYIQTLLTRYASDDVSNDKVEAQLIFDTERDHYQWINLGFYIFGVVISARCIFTLSLD